MYCLEWFLCQWKCSLSLWLMTTDIINDCEDSDPTLTHCMMPLLFRIMVLHWSRDSTTRFYI
jgi:hypothetical protein